MEQKMLSKQQIDLMTDKQFIEILKEKLQDAEKEVKDAEEKIKLYKNWHLGSPHQQRSRKKSFDKNSEQLPILQGKVNLIKRMLKEYEK